MPTNTRAARLTQHGAPLVIDDVLLPDPGPGEELITLAYAGVNPIDRYAALGRVAADVPLPRTLGREASGWTADGRLVAVFGGGLGTARDGVYAHRAVVPSAALFAVPDGLDPKVAAVAPIVGATAYEVVTLLDPAPGEAVLVLGAGGGVGLPLVSYLAFRGVRVYGQVGTASKAAAVRAAGATEVVVADATSLGDALRAAGVSEPLAGVVDPLGGPFVAASFDLLDSGGRYVVFGTSAGNQVELNWQLVYRNNLRVRGYGGLALSAEQHRRGLEQTLSILARGEMRIPVQRAYPLAEVNAAFAALAARDVTGKVVLDLRDPAEV